MKPNKASEQAEEESESTPDATPSSDSGMQEGVSVPEEFQAAVHKLTHKATKAHLSHMRDKINSREDDIRNEEMSKKGVKGNMSMEDAPSNIGD